ncbi:hypothetical protein I551_5929 [Mycobacterium ulcerans str. Harvey]|uniref:Sodium Bile acid symporter family protein n=1 Tax=Mycobacterium ulcerans str. Harvey TaxID=1299332 RepID=A0ABP3A844_MYCUL|nr:hypothetical protein I551_5929 [Mycobacterium ulcerans str. Harvey]
MLHEFWENFTHNLFKPLLLFFYFGFLIPILKVRFEFPYVIYQGLTMYLLLAIGWHGGEELAKIKPSSIGSIVGFMGVGFVLNFLIGGLAYLLLSRMSRMRRVDRATVAGYYGSDSAGTFATCVAVLTSVGIAFNAYMPVMLAVMEIPGCLVALYLVARLRHRGMDEAGYMPDEPGYTPRPRSRSDRVPPHGPRAARAWKARMTAKSSRSWSFRWKSGRTRTRTNPPRAAAGRRCSPGSSSRRSSSTPGWLCCSGASSSA